PVGAAPGGAARSPCHARVTHPKRPPEGRATHDPAAPAAPRPVDRPGRRRAARRRRDPPRAGPRLRRPLPPRHARCRIGGRLPRRWTAPVASGLLVVAAILLARVLGSDDLSNLAMVAAAVVAGAPVAVKAVRALAVKVVGIDLLVTVAAAGAVVIGEYWEAAAVTFLFAVGHALELATLTKTRLALAELVAVAPDVAVVLRDGEQVEIGAAQVRTGETVLVKNGAKVPVDGEVTAGTGALDEASITGESVPVEKVAGDRVFA